MIELRKFQNDAATQIAKRYAFFANHEERPGTRTVGSPFFQALSALTGAGKTPILAEAVTLIRDELHSEPIVLWMSKARSVVTQTFNNFNGGKYAHLIEGFHVCQIKDLKGDMLVDSTTPLLVLTTTGLFNNKDQAEGGLRIYQPDQDKQGEKTMWERLIERHDGKSRRPLIVVYDEAHNLSEQQTDILKELRPEAWLLASATIKLPSQFQGTVVQPIRNWVLDCTSEIGTFAKLQAVKEGRPHPDLFMTLAVDSQKVVLAELVKNAIQFDGTTAPMEQCIDELFKRRGLLKKQIAACGLNIRPKAIYVSRTNITDDGLPDDPAKPFNLRQARPIRIWRYLVEQKMVDPATIAIYADLKFVGDNKPDAVVHFSKGEDDFDKFQQGDYQHIIFNQSLQEGWDDPECYLAYIDKSMGSNLQVQQVIGRVLRQPGVKHYEREPLNAAHFFLRVDNKCVFTEALDEVKAKLEAEGAPIAISSSFAAGSTPAAIEIHRRSNVSAPLHHIYVEKAEALEKITEILSQFPTYEENSPDTLGQAERAKAVIKLNKKDIGPVSVDWQEDGHTNPVRLRWLLNVAIRSHAPQAMTVADLKAKKFDVRVQVRSKADAMVNVMAERIAAAFFEHSELIYEDGDVFDFGPMRVVKDGANRFTKSLYSTYGELNDEELTFARALDKAGVTWHRNPSSGGFSIPLLSPGDTAHFYPDFLAWKNKMVFALDTKGKHLLTDALARKMFDIYEGKTIRMHVRFIVKGRQAGIGAKTTDKRGYTVWRTKSNSPKPFYVETIEEAVAECLE